MTTRSTRLLPLQRQLRGLAALELLQRSIAVGSLVAIAIYAAATAPDPAVAIGISVAMVLALVQLALAFRLRLGQTPVHRDLIALEIREALESGGVTLGDPYRSCAGERSALSPSRYPCARAPTTSSVWRSSPASSRHDPSATPPARSESRSPR
jgi:hypothetical protein